MDRLCPIVGDRAGESRSIVDNIEDGIVSREKIIAQNPEEIATRLVNVQWNEDTVAQVIIRSIIQDQDVLQRGQRKRLTTDHESHIGKRRKWSVHTIDGVLERQSSSSDIRRSRDYHGSERIKDPTNGFV